MEVSPTVVAYGYNFIFLYFMLQLCITLNNIEHVRVYLDNLPQLLQWDKNIKDLTIEHHDQIAGKNTLDALHRLTAMASEDVLMKSSMLEKKIADRMCSEVSKFMENVVNPSASNDEDVRKKYDTYQKWGTWQQMVFIKRCHDDHLREKERCSKKS